jgi:alanyl-tRNA synthetase
MEGVSNLRNGGAVPQKPHEAEFAGDDCMTTRLYYTEAYAREFTGRVLECRRIDDKPAVILDQTAFYPESGGQPCDTGILHEARVLNVREEESGAILHVLDREIPLGPASGQIDWPRRFDHMQQHTGQHILSQAFLQAAQAQTLSFHMGSEASTIDIDLAQPSSAQMEAAQFLATTVVFENRSVHIRMTDQDGLSSLGVRKGSQREGEIRVIDIEGVDRSPCGGTHVRQTGEIGLIFVLGFERYKGGTRVEFVAGGRALKALQKDHELLKKLARLHSVMPEALPALQEKLAQERMALTRENELLRDRLLDLEVGELLRNATKTNHGLLISGRFANRKLEEIKLLAQKLTAQPGVIAILGIADACQVVAARSKDLPGNCGEAIKKAAVEYGGKGGGRPEMAQAGGFASEFFYAWMSALEKYFGS